MNIIEFVEMFNLDSQPVNVEIRNGKKRLLPQKAKQNDFRNKNIKREELLERKENLKYDYTAIHTNKNMCVIDVDFEDGKEYSNESLEWVEEMKKQLPYKKSTTKARGLHLFFDGSKNKFKKMRLPNTPYPDIEILAGQWTWEKNDSVIYNVGDTIPMLEITTKKENLTNNENFTTSSESENTTNTTDLIEEWINNIDVSKVDSYVEWFDTLCKIKQHGEKYKEAARRLSQKSKNYGKFDETWDSIKVEDNIFNKVVSPSTDFYNLFHTNVVVNQFDGKTEVYCYCIQSRLWKRDDSYKHIKEYIGKLLGQQYRIDIATEQDDGRRKFKLKVLLNLIESNSWRADVAATFIGKVLVNQFENVKFDSIDYLYHFKNTTLDLRDLTFRDRTREDYCTMFGCHLRERNDAHVLLWDSIINSIFTDEEVKQTYLNLIINSFSGIVLQKFIVFNGSGSNGKGMLDNCFKYLHNDYYYKGACTDLCQPAKGGSNPSLANCHKKRFCVYTEPNEKDSLQVSTIKDMTGEDTINARKNYSNDTETKMGGVKIIECNKRCKLSGDTGYSIQRRLVDLLFASTFKTDDGISQFDSPYDKETNPTGYQKANREYETAEWRMEYCSDLFWYLYDYMVENDKDYSNLSDFIICQSVKERTNEYIHDNNTFLAFLHNYIEPSKEDCVSVPEIVDAVKGDYEKWKILNRNEKRDITCPRICKKIAEDPQLSGAFYKRKVVEGKTKYNVLLNYKLIKQEVVEELLEEEPPTSVEEEGEEANEGEGNNEGEGEGED